MKGSRLEPESDYVHLVDARAAFLAEAYHTLPEAFEELREVAQGKPDSDLDAIETWAGKWGVNAPFVRHIAKEMVDDIRRNPQEGGWSRVSRSEAVHEAWLHHLATWNRLPVSMSADNGVASGTMLEPQENDPRTRKVVAAPFERLLEQDHILGPIATNPRGEFLHDFLARARHHWQARAQVGMRQYGFTPVASKPEFESHLQWLMDYQFHNKSFAEIARNSGRTPDAVRHAVRRLAERLELNLRKAPKGRPASA